MGTIKCLFLLLIFNCSQNIIAQTVSTLPAQKTNTDFFFLYEVKLIDEFIERFNDDPHCYIREQCKALYHTDSIITRRKLLKSLLDKKKGWSADTAQFFHEVLDPAHPGYLSFTDSNWYAEVRCVFLYNNSKIEVPLVLHIKAAGQGSKWMIAGIEKSELFKNVPVSAPRSNDTQISINDFIPTSSHGTDFVVFNYIFSEQMQAAAYFEPGLLGMPRTQYFTRLVKQQKIKFLYVKNIKYHFFTLPGWVFTVEQFKRKETNTGWLISSLQKVNPTEKEVLLKKLLQ